MTERPGGPSPSSSPTSRAPRASSHPWARVTEEVLAAHRRLLRDAFGSHGGAEVDTESDAFFYAFSRASDALAGAVAGQRALSSHDFGGGVELPVRMEHWDWNNGGTPWRRGRG
jgi:class 3 adenylate cyclase